MESSVESIILKATNDDIPAITMLLKETNLPPDDLERWIDNFLVLTYRRQNRRMYRTRTMGCCWSSQIVRSFRELSFERIGNQTLHKVDSFGKRYEFKLDHITRYGSFGILREKWF